MKEGVKHSDQLDVFFTNDKFAHWYSWLYTIYYPPKKELKAIQIWKSLILVIFTMSPDTWFSVLALKLVSPVSCSIEITWHTHVFLSQSPEFTLTCTPFRFLILGCGSKIFFYLWKLKDFNVETYWFYIKRFYDSWFIFVFILINVVFVKKRFLTVGPSKTQAYVYFCGFGCIHDVLFLVYASVKLIGYVRR